jgi:adenylate cyclase
MERRLAAIVIADVVGYSNLIRHDEAGTIARFQNLQTEVFQPLIAENGGRLVKTMGDAYLIEFTSAVAAVECSVNIQNAVLIREKDMPSDSRILFRFGVNLGDIIVDGDDIQGDGVNVAARLEALAKPGSICIAGKVYEEVRDRIDLPFTDLGMQEVKNIDRPVQVWQWEPANAPAAPPPREGIEPPSLPAQASIAVLPLDNMSDSRDFEYLADAMTEDIITLLARIPSFFVIARNSTFFYKGKRPDIREVGRDLGVRYVIEGSLRPLGERLRVTIQLIEAETGKHIWADRFDRIADDLFEVQDDITTAVVARLEPELNRAEFELIRRRPPADLDAWDYYQRAVNFLAVKGWNEDSFTEATDDLRKAIALDPEFAPARANLSLLLAIGHLVGYVTEPDEALNEADRAIALDSDSSEVLGFAGCALCDLGNKTRGIELLNKAIERDPSNPQAWVALGAALLTNRQPEEAVEKFAHGLRISPRDSRLGFWGATYALALGFVNRVDDAIEQARVACRHDDKLHNPRVVLAALLAATERPDEAKAALAEAMRIKPNLSLQEARGLVGGRYANMLESVWPAK